MSSPMVELLVVGTDPHRTDFVAKTASSVPLRAWLLRLGLDETRTCETGHRPPAIVSEKER